MTITQYHNFITAIKITFLEIVFHILYHLLMTLVKRVMWKYYCDVYRFHSIRRNLPKMVTCIFILTQPTTGNYYSHTK